MQHIQGEFFAAYAVVGLVILAGMVILWAASLTLRNASIIDIFWGVGFVAAAWVYFALTPTGFSGRKILVCALVSLWGLRLSFYILWRNWGKPEDFRYHKWRDDAGKKWWWLSFFQVFLLQGVLLWVISAPLLAAQSAAAPAYFTGLDCLAALVWLAGFFFEAAGDWQMARFKAYPANRGKVLSAGLWRYTRHPNYFGDAVQWWAFFTLAAAAGAYWTVFSPLLMTILLLRVSGVSLLEQTLKETRPGYKEYIEATSGFIPWRPKK